jgi:DNA-binding transcriptional MerR regulator
VIKRLLDAGMSLKKIRSAVDILREQMSSEQPLVDVTLLSDGQTIYAAHSEQEVVDVFRRGQGVFGIAIGPVQDEVEGAIHQLFPDQDLAGVVEAGAP